jgi:isoprenylcysteine carboxyl methyltransferase (ICMT) family protein YpbQ
MKGKHHTTHLTMLFEQLFISLIFMAIRQNCSVNKTAQVNRLVILKGMQETILENKASPVSYARLGHTNYI